MAGSRFNEPIEPMTLQNMRDNGVRSLLGPNARSISTGFLRPQFGSSAR
jgi:hypothetical protein